MDGQSGNGSNGAYIPQEGEYAGSSSDSELDDGEWVDVHPAPASDIWASAGTTDASQLRTLSAANAHQVVIQASERLYGIWGKDRTARDSFRSWWNTCSTSYVNTRTAHPTLSHAAISRHFLADVSMQHFCQTIQLIAGEQDMPITARLNGAQALRRGAGNAFIRAWQNRTQWQYAPNDTAQTQ